MPEIVLTPSPVVREPDIAVPPAEVMSAVRVPVPRAPEQVDSRSSPLPTSEPPTPVVELGFADGRRAQMPPASPQTAALLAAATRLLERRG